MNWVSRAQKEFLLNHQSEIWKRHQECGFILSIDGSENHKLHFRDGRYDYACGSIFHFWKAKTTLTCQMSHLWLGGKDKRFAGREEFFDVEDYKDEERDVEDFTIPKKTRKRKIGSNDRKVKKSRLQIPKISSRKRRVQEPPGPSSDLPPRRPRKPKASQITSKN